MTKICKKKMDIKYKIYKNKKKKIIIIKKFKRA